MQYPSYVHNQDIIEETWDKNFGDRKNEIVFIGQTMDKDDIIATLESCLSTEEELASQKWRLGYDDEWPVKRPYEMD